MLRMFRLGVLVGALVPVGAVAGRGGGTVEAWASCPAGVEVVLCGSGWGREWEAFSRTKVYRHLGGWWGGREVLLRLRGMVRGLEAVGLGPKELVRFFGGRAAWMLLNRDLEHPDHLLVVSAEADRQLFDEVFTAAGFFAAVHGVAGGRRSVRDGVTTLSVASNLHIAYDGRRMVMGVRREAVEGVWSVQAGPSLGEDPLFRALLSNFRPVPEHLLFVRDASVVSGLLPVWASSALASFVFRPSVSVRLAVEAVPSAGDVAGRFRSAVLTSPLLSYVPSSAVYVQGLCPSADGWPDGGWMVRLLPFRDRRLERNVTVYSSWFALPVMTNVVSAAVFCRLYGGSRPSTNHVFVFRVRGRTSAEEYARALWPGREVRRGWYERVPVLYYGEGRGEDGFNYLCLDGETLLVADAFRPLAAALQAKMTGRNLGAGSVVRRSKGLWMVFRPPAWVGHEVGEERPELAKEVAAVSSHVVVTVSALKTGGGGIIMEVVNTAGKTEPSP